MTVRETSEDALIALCVRSISLRPLITREALRAGSNELMSYFGLEESGRNLSYSGSHEARRVDLILTSCEKPMRNISRHRNCKCDDIQVVS